MDVGAWRQDTRGSCFQLAVCRTGKPANKALDEREQNYQVIPTSYPEYIKLRLVINYQNLTTSS